uniref:Uncharacterized protein n=1 Tax=viral metagenome TaxID=1070528 RepID=A0A6M3J5K9_9ZZZZ
MDKQLSLFDKQEIYYETVVKPVVMRIYASLKNCNDVKSTQNQIKTISVNYPPTPKAMGWASDFIERALLPKSDLLSTLVIASS